ncbi:SGNH/GDSL hydrolase family protein [Psittacicella hinzii]|uniref:Uncharacterized protein n=1 Tax=Psittacicella hinzii TaxID=2028575 RepID=A0A3A1YHU5_9GAMM|nr:DUF459 domain-containing protein [Psittacicella hinzii]RIY36778.1 hypothetical protein CKF58_05690 [Psittacicella hinzii]
MIKKILISFLASLVILFWLFQTSINNYWLSLYNQPSPLTKLDKYPAWQWGKEFNDKLLLGKDYLINLYSEYSNQLTTTFNSHLEQVKTEDDHQVLADNSDTNNVDVTSTSESIHEQAQTTSHNSASNDPKTPVLFTMPMNEFAIGIKDKVAGDLDYASYTFTQQANPIVLHPGDEVLIAGDSMQQGVGRHIRAYLSANYKIQSKDLSKQSTGLLNPANLDWNKTISQELAQSNNYKLLIMMLGANDSYGLYDSVNHKALAFGTKEWQAHYLQRVMSVLYQARSRGIAVIWILVPNMKSPDLNQKMHLLNQLFRNASQQYGTLTVDANQALQANDQDFTPSAIVDNKLRKTRSDDGVHFTITGEKLIASAVEKNIVFRENKTKSSQVNTKFDLTQLLTLPRLAKPNYRFSLKQQN